MMTNAVFTGAFVVASTGLGNDRFWTSTLDKRNGIAPVQAFDASSYPATLAGEVRDFDDAALVPSRLLPQTDRVTRFSIAAADGAIRDSGVDLSTVPDLDAGVVTASSSGGFEFSQRELQKLWSKGGQYVSAYQSFAWFYAVNTGQISIKNGLRGASGVLVSEGAGGLDALAQARRQIRKGARLMLTGGMDASICPWGWVGLERTGTVSRASQPDAAYLPFDARACGYVPAEGGAILVLEDEGAARARGARIRGRLSGYAATFDAGSPETRAEALERAITAALHEARVSARDVDVVFADAAGTRTDDAIEAAALRQVFGAGGVAVTAPKTMTGRLCSGSGAQDVATALLAMDANLVPPTVNTSSDPLLDVDLVTEATARQVDHVLVVARGIGGFVSALVLTAAR
ncbi:MAG: ketosynthase chain-length factor [Dermatophilaceae bacterium]